MAFDGSPAELGALARGHVWTGGWRMAYATVAWRTGDGAHRHIGDAPPGARIVEPALEDGYLILLGEAAGAAVVA